MVLYYQYTVSRRILIFNQDDLCQCFKVTLDYVEIDIRQEGVILVDLKKL
jgi:hypothetical protein